MLSLAYADGTDTSAANLQLVTVSVVIVGAAAFLGTVPLWGAWRRKHRHLEIIGAAMVIWAVVVAWSGVSFFAATADAEKEKALRIESGYDSNPTDTSAPAPPLAFWSALAVGWLLVNAWAFLMPYRRTADAELPFVLQPSHLGPASEDASSKSMPN